MATLSCFTSARKGLGVASVRPIIARPRISTKLYSLIRPAVIACELPDFLSITS